MEYNNQNTNINQLITESLDATYEEVPQKNCKKCKRKSKKHTRWMFFWGFYFLVFIIWGHISLFKLIISLF